MPGRHRSQEEPIPPVAPAIQSDGILPYGCHSNNPDRLCYNTQVKKFSFIALVVIAISAGIVAFALYGKMRGATAGQTEVASPVAALTGGPGAGSALIETPLLPVQLDLSPETRIAAERYRCICGCPDTLSACRCTKDPGGITMKNHLQGLVDRGLSTEELDQEMVKKYGEEVILFLDPGSSSR